MIRKERRGFEICLLPERTVQWLSTAKCHGQAPGRLANALHVDTCFDALYQKPNRPGAEIDRVKHGMVLIQDCAPNGIHRVV